MKTMRTRFAGWTRLIVAFCLLVAFMIIATATPATAKTAAIKQADSIIASTRDGPALAMHLLRHIDSTSTTANPGNGTFATAICKAGDTVLIDGTRRHIALATDERVALITSMRAHANTATPLLL